MTGTLKPRLAKHSVRSSPKRQGTGNFCRPTPGRFQLLKTCACYAALQHCRDLRARLAFLNDVLCLSCARLVLLRRKAASRTDASQERSGEAAKPR